MFDDEIYEETPEKNLFEKFVDFSSWAFDHNSFFIVISAALVYVTVFMSYVFLCLYVATILHWTAGFVLFLSLPVSYLYYAYAKDTKDED